MEQQKNKGEVLGKAKGVNESGLGVEFGIRTLGQTEEGYHQEDNQQRGIIRNQNTGQEKGAASEVN